ncbi:MAG TPA: type I 3-dehydroquinate dehydratase [Verrucomicrobiales bacterium]|nr:type I 3-dehydroquinate dehydratase [Verrucomicrobiales bacterium]
MVKRQQRKTPSPRSLVGAVADLDTWRRLPRLRNAAAADYIEIRADAFPLLLDPSGPTSVQTSVPLLLTVRRADEGGYAASLSDGERASCYARLLPQASLVDLEIRSLSSLRGTLRLARSAGVPLVASFHDFSRTPSRRRLQTLILRAEQAGAAVVKIATYTRSVADVATLAGLLERPVSQVPLSLMGMGPLGAASRILLAQLGSVLNYGYLLRPNAPGQWSIALFRQILNALPPLSPPEIPASPEAPAAKT